MMSSLKELLLGQLALLPDEIQSVRDDISEIGLQLQDERISRVQGRMSSLLERVLGILQVVKGEYGDDHHGLDGGGDGGGGGVYQTEQQRSSEGPKTDLQQHQEEYSVLESIPSSPAESASFSEDDGVSEISELSDISDDDDGDVVDNPSHERSSTSSKGTLKNPPAAAAAGTTNYEEVEVVRVAKIVEPPPPPPTHNNSEPVTLTEAGRNRCYKCFLLTNTHTSATCPTRGRNKTAAEKGQIAERKAEWKRIPAVAQKMRASRQRLYARRKEKKIKEKVEMEAKVRNDRPYKTTTESTNSVPEYYIPPHLIPWSLETFRRKLGGGGGGEGGGKSQPTATARVQTEARSQRQ